MTVTYGPCVQLNFMIETDSVELRNQMKAI